MNRSFGNRRIASTVIDWLVGLPADALCDPRGDRLPESAGDRCLAPGDGSHFRDVDGSDEIFLCSLIPGQNSSILGLN